MQSVLGGVTVTVQYSIRPPTSLVQCGAMGDVMGFVAWVLYNGVGASAGNGLHVDAIVLCYSDLVVERSLSIVCKPMWQCE